MYNNIFLFIHVCERKMYAHEEILTHITNKYSMRLDKNKKSLIFQNCHNFTAVILVCLKMMNIQFVCLNIGLLSDTLDYWDETPQRVRAQHSPSLLTITCPSNPKFIAW